MSPSPQRTPLLFQAGASEADRAFAARNAEAVFIRSPSLTAVAHDTADIRSRAASADPRRGRAGSGGLAALASSSRRVATCANHMKN